MHPQDRFPNELWLEIFAYLPPTAHRSLSSTHRTLYDIARRLGFVEFTLYLYPYEFQPPQAQLDYSLERLNFWTSPKIAPYVRSCAVRESTQLWPGSSQIQENEEFPHVLMNTFFEQLPHFTGLQRLTANHIRITQSGIVNLCGLPALTHVEFVGVAVAAGERIDPAGLMLRVASFTTRYDYAMGNIWTSLLARDTLRELNLSMPLPLAMPNVLPFPNVQALKMYDFPLHISDTVTIFRKFLNLREFTSDYRGVLRHLTPAWAVSILPILQKYCGAYENLHIFVQRPTLTHIRLDGGFAFQKFATELQGVRALPNITSFTAQFTTSAQTPFHKTEIDTLFTLFPNLCELDLKLIPDPEHDGSFTPQPTSFLKMLASNPLLPNTLQSLSLEWDFLFQDDSGSDSTTGNDPIAPDPAEVPDFTTLRAELLAKSPALTYIFLNGYHFLFLWWKTSSSVWEATAHNYGELTPGGDLRRFRGNRPIAVC
ncbi:hypothetical protein C8R45DRAFT_1083617, partial [Mycena sanguinolenta]